MQVRLEISYIPKGLDLEMDSCLPRGIENKHVIKEILNFEIHSR